MGVDETFFRKKIKRGGGYSGPKSTRKNMRKYTEIEFNIMKYGKTCLILIALLFVSNKI